MPTVEYTLKIKGHFACRSHCARARLPQRQPASQICQAAAAPRISSLKNKISWGKIPLIFGIFPLFFNFRVIATSFHYGSVLDMDLGLTNMCEPAATSHARAIVIQVRCTFTSRFCKSVCTLRKKSDMRPL